MIPEGTREAIDFIVDKGIMPERGPYSHSRLTLCPENFYYKYIEKKPSEQSPNIRAMLGSSKHELVDKDIRGAVSNRNREWISVDELVDTHLQEQDYEFLQEHSETLRMWRNSFEVNFDNYMGSEEKMGAFINMTQGDYDNGAWYRGIIDYNELRPDGLAVITDWKNYPHIHSNADLANLSSGVGAQLMGYACLLFANYPTLNAVISNVYYLMYGVTRSVCEKTEEGDWQTKIITRDEAQDWWKSIQRKMLSWERRSEFPASPSGFNCQYCDYINSCSYMALESPSRPLTTHDEAESALGRLVVLNEQVKRLRSSLKVFSTAAGLVQTPVASYGPTKTLSVSYDTKKIMDVFEKDDLAKILTVNKNDLKRVLKTKSSETAEKVAECEIHTVKTGISLK